MSIITNYPNVPIVTSNVATDSMRNDNEHKPNVTPTVKVTKPHAERAIDPEKEHDSHQQQHEQQNQHHQKAEDEISLIEELEADNLKAKEILTMKNAALSRADIKIQVDESESTSNDSLSPHQNKNALKQEDIDQVKKNLDSAYQTEQNKPKSKLSEWG